MNACFLRYFRGLRDKQKPQKTKINDEEFVMPIDLSSIKFKGSPNCSKRKREINSIVLHHTGPGSFNGIVSWLRNKDASASAHYVIGTQGEVNQLVKLEDKAWHVGRSKHKILTDSGSYIFTNLNENSIGIEICNVGVLQKGEDEKFYYEVGRNLKEWEGQMPEKKEIKYPDGRVVEGYSAPYPKEQVDLVIALCKALVDKFPAIKKENILTHFETAYPLGRKNDPFGLDVEYIKVQVFDT